MRHVLRLFLWVFLCLLNFGVLQAQWIYWKDDITGNWFTATNWVGDEVPQAFNNASIDNRGDVLIDNSVMAAAGSEVNIGVLNEGILRIQAGGMLDSVFSYVGLEAGSVGEVLVNGSGSLWSVANTVHIGLRGTGTLNINAAGRVEADFGKVGTDLSGVGNVTVAGAGSSWVLANDLIVGDKGEGTLEVFSGAEVSSGNLFLGYDSTGWGAAQVGGNNSLISLTKSIYVGFGGGAELLVESGAKVESALLASEGTLSIGHLSGASGKTTVTGAGSAMSLRDSILVGYQGEGTLEIWDEGSVSSNAVSIGHEQSASGMVKVGGAGSTLSVSEGLVVGQAGQGELQIGESAEVLADRAYLGNSSTGSGSVSVDRSGILSITEDLYVGYQGSAVLGVSNAGQVFADTAYIGYEQAIASSTVNVSGTDSLFEVTNQLNVGNSGVGLLNVLSGGAVKVSTMSLGAEVGGSGEVNILGLGSSVEVSAQTVVGDSAVGKLNVTTGASITSNQVILGAAATGNGEATVTGEGSLWQSTDSLTIGAEGVGKVNVTLAGRLTAESIIMGSQLAGQGELNIANDGTEVEVTGNVTIGEAGEGYLGMTGGSLISSESFLGYDAGAVGTARVFAGTWDNELALTVGFSGSGSLTLSGTGTLRIDSGSGTLLLASQSGSSGVLNLGEGDTVGNLQAAEIQGGAGTAEVQLNHAGTYTVDPVLTGSLSVTKSGAGMSILGNANTYAGGTFVNDGTLRVSNLSGSATGSGDVVVDFLGTLEGNGAIAGTVYVDGTISPGESVGLLTTGSQIWGETGIYLWEIGDAIGGGLIWDRLDILGDLTLASTALSPFTIKLTTLSLAGEPGALDNFSDLQNYEWTIASVSGVIEPWLAEQVYLDTSEFANPFTGSFSLFQDGTEMKILYSAIPEPSVFGLLIVVFLILQAGPRFFRRLEKSP